jgi:hypothetical protein
VAGFLESDIDLQVIDPILDVESILIVVIFMIAMLVFLVMLFWLPLHRKMTVGEHIVRLKG